MAKFWTTKTVYEGDDGIEIVEMDTREADDSIEKVATGLTKSNACKVMDAMQDAQTLAAVLRYVARHGNADLLAGCNQLLTHRQRELLQK